MWTLKMFLPRDVFWDVCFWISSAFSNGAFEHLSRTTMLIKALELNFKANPQPRMAGHVCVGMSKHSVCKTTTVQHALPLHGWTKTRRLRAVTVSLDRHCSLCQIYLLNHGNCGHCFRHIHCLPGTCTGTYTMWDAKTCQSSSTRGVCEQQQQQQQQQQQTFRCRYTHRQKHVVSVRWQRFCSDTLEDTLPVWKLPKARPLEIILFKWAKL